MTQALSAAEVDRLHREMRALGGTPTGQDPTALTGAAATALRLFRPEAAIALADAALVQDPNDARAWAIKGAAFEAFQQPLEAERAYQRSLQLDDHDLPVTLSLAELLAERGDKARARALLVYLLRRERSAPALRQRAQQLLDACEVST